MQVYPLLLLGRQYYRFCHRTKLEWIYPVRHPVINVAKKVKKTKTHHPVWSGVRFSALCEAMFFSYASAM